MKSLLKRRRGQDSYDWFVGFMEMPMLALSLLFIVLIIVPVFVDLPEHVETGVRVTEGAIWAVFVFEYLGLLYLAPKRWVMVKSHWLDLLIIVLPMLRPLRAGRALRLARVFTLAGRASEAVRRIGSRPGFTPFLVFVMIVVAIGGLTTFSFEHRLAESPIDTPGDGLWWAIVTVTTVGYGDYYPVSVEGRAVAVLLMLVGLALLSVITANIAAFFIQDDEGAALAEMGQRMEHLERLLVAEELTKLIGLRDAGELSDGEFDAQRNRLLERGPEVDGPDPAADLTSTTA